MRKRLQRVRDKLRKEIEMAEQRGADPWAMPAICRQKLIELLARPRLTDLPENPVDETEHAPILYPEFVDLPRCPK